MKRKEIVSFLEGARRDGSLIRLKRRWEGLTWSGFVVGLSDAWVLLHQVDAIYILLNGYVALRVEDVERVKPETSFAGRLLELRGERAFPQPDILLVDLPGLLSSSDAHFPLITVHLEGKDPDSCWVGRVEKTTKRYVMFRKIDKGANWVREPQRFRLADVTRVEFGGAYEAALWQVAEHDRRLTEHEIDEDE